MSLDILVNADKATKEEERCFFSDYMFGFAKKLVTFANDKDFYSNIKKRMLMKKGLLHRFLMVTSVLFSCSFTHAADVIPTADIF